MTPTEAVVDAPAGVQPVPLEILKPMPEAEAVYRRWLAHLHAEFSRHTTCTRRSEIVRDELHMILLGRPHGGRMNAALISELPLAVLAETLDPRNVTLPAEMQQGLDRDRFANVKPLLWFWRGFDRTILGANLWLGLRFRAMLGQHIFAGVGKNVRFYRDVSFERGYTLTFADDTTILPNTRIDDTEPVTLSGTVS
jgi:acetyltransferase-like isoleucine patch superfamily enzyme